MDRRRLLLLGSLAFAASAALFAIARPRARTPAPLPLPTITILGVARPEGCLLCHASTQGLGAAHEAMGCSPCHLGDALAREEAAAHRGMELLSGDLATSDRTCGQGACHPIETARVRTSLMARAPGILAVDRFTFGDRATPDGEASDDLPALDPAKPPASPAESHVRQLCASCHLGVRKPRAGDLGFAARGGGCTACHLAAPAPRRGDGPLHPDVNAAVPERRCEGCHARSGRISLSYRGVVELEPGDPRVTGKLEDGRPIGNASADVHAAKMTCIDCHTERELMGDGALHRHAHEARDVECRDCHEAKLAPPGDADREAVAARLRASWMRRGRAPLSTTPIRTSKGTPLYRTDAEARTLVLAESGERRAIPQASTAAYHALRGHARLDCQACHSAWAPRCGSCHTRFDAAGKGVDHLSGKEMSGLWIEEAGQNGFGPPLLAVGPTGRIEPFVEGMDLRLDVPAWSGAPAREVRRTLFAPLDPHTTGKARACASCHAPARAPDVYPLAGETTRSGARILDALERAKILAVGPCLRCHPSYEDGVYRDFAASLARLPRSCVTRR